MEADKIRKDEERRLFKIKALEEEEKLARERLE